MGATSIEEEMVEYSNIEREGEVESGTNIDGHTEAWYHREPASFSPPSSDAEQRGR